jgi:hypothetical protein
MAAFTAGVVFLALASAAPVCAQEEHHDDAAPAAHQDDAKPEHDEAKPEHQEAEPKDDKTRKQDEKAAHPPDPGRQQEAKPDEKEAHRDNASPAQAHNGGGGGGRIPDDRFLAKFGRQHTFRVSRPVIVAGQPRFQYSGYWFQFQQPWPDGWSYDDQCYIDYVDDGYYLFNPVHPGIRIAVMVIS